MATVDASGRRGKHCCVYGCSNSFYDKEGRKTELHFFKFPVSPKRTRDRWCNLIKRQHNKDGFQITASTRICEAHFKAEEIKKTPGGGRRTLKKGKKDNYILLLKEIDI